MPFPKKTCICTVSLCVFVYWIPLFIPWRKVKFKVKSARGRESSRNIWIQVLKFNFKFTSLCWATLVYNIKNHYQSWKRSKKSTFMYKIIFTRDFSTILMDRWSENLHFTNCVISNFNFNFNIVALKKPWNTFYLCMVNILFEV